jgi:hypothetical protein
VLDATFTDEVPQFVLEGLAPTYKTYPLYRQTKFKTEADQDVFKGSISSAKPLDLIAPHPRPHGGGFGQRRKCRFIPIVQCEGEGGRAEGRRGAAAFLMLSDSYNYPFSHVDTRPGAVCSSIIGSALGGIGFTEQDVLSIDGAGELLASMLGSLVRGLHLYEGGSDKFVYRKGERPVLGARVLNTRMDYLPTRLRFKLSENGASVFESERELLATPRNISALEVPCPVKLKDGVDYKVEVELLFDGARVDRVENETATAARRKAKSSEFVKIRKGKFIAAGKVWNPVGINYWPGFFAGVEEVENWYGWLSDKYYDQLEVERDLAFLEKSGFDFVMTRMDGNIFDRSMPQLLDFLKRCARHGIKVSLAWPEAMSPLYYNKAAVEKLFAESGIHNDPTVICYDLVWELGGQPLSDWFKSYWDADWRKWIAERYGSLENAEGDWNFAVPRDAKGEPCAPSQEQLREDGPWRVMVAAYRRFMDDLMSRKWNDASRHMRACAPRQLLTFRTGNISHADVSYSSTNKHVDFLAPEGYSFPLGADGFNASAFLARYLDFAGNGKPIVWSEFGISSIGMRGGKCFWDRKTLTPPAEKLATQDEYLRQFYKMILDTGCEGLAPWWWCAGVRKREMSDFGFLAPDGTLRPCAESLRALMPELKRERARPKADEFFAYDRDARADGLYGICFGEGARAYAEAAAKGRTLGVRSAGTGKNSANCPLTAVGNTPCGPNNPPKHLNAEFNFATIQRSDGKTVELENGASVKIEGAGPLRLRVGIGNTEEAKWLAPKKGLAAGAVRLVSLEGSDERIAEPIPRDVSRFQDVELEIELARTTPGEKRRIRIQLEAEGRCRFGEILDFEMETQRD